jgi:undecaprenyl-diphosphatase
MTIDIGTNALMISIENAPFTLFSKIIAHALEPAILAILGILIASYLYLKVSKKKGIFFAATILATGVLIKVLKEIFGRIRPANALMPDATFAMPSGHATIAVVFFGLIAFLFTNKKHKAIALTVTTFIAMIVGFTRLYLRVHWLTDVIAGFALGAIILATSIIIYRKY